MQDKRMKIGYQAHEKMLYVLKYEWNDDYGSPVGINVH